MSLRTRLAWIYGGAFFVAVVLLAISSLVLIDRSLRSSLDGRLATAAIAGTGLVDVHDDALSLDQEDRGHLLQVLASNMEAAVFTASGKTFTASVGSIPRDVIGLDAWTHSGVRYYSVGSGERELRVAVAPVKRGGNVFGAVAVWAASDYIDEFDRNAIIVMTFAALLIGGVVIVLSSTLSRRALAPLERFTELATEIEAHDLSQRLGTSAPEGELGRLSSAFDRMLDRLEAAFGRQRRFTADASHELRAPLAVIRAEADVALTRDRTTDEYRSALQAIVQEVDRIDALVDALLVAARADSARLRLERIDVGALALLTVERFRQAAQARSIEIATDAADVEVEGDAHALERALATIIHNAIDFAGTRIDVRVRREADTAEITVKDDGPGFTREGLLHATDRFWRADQARSRGGTGLGLSIAEAIVRAHGGRIELSNVAPHGACVTVHLPFMGRSSAPGILG